jgi:hypothetical protein
VFLNQCVRLFPPEPRLNRGHQQLGGAEERQIPRELARDTGGKRRKVLQHVQ